MKFKKEIEDILISKNKRIGTINNQKYSLYEFANYEKRYYLEKSALLKEYPFDLASKLLGQEITIGKTTHQIINVSLCYDEKYGKAIIVTYAPITKKESDYLTKINSFAVQRLLNGFDSFVIYNLDRSLTQVIEAYLQYYLDVYQRKQYNRALKCKDEQEMLWWGNNAIKKYKAICYILKALDNYKHYDALDGETEYKKRQKTLTKAFKKLSKIYSSLWS